MKTYLECHALEQLVVLARTKNFTQAALELNLSQSALTRAIQKLEQQLGQPLFERKPREVALTDHGELLLGRAKEILRLVEDTFSELTEDGRRGRIRLGAIPTIAPYFLPSLLSSFAKKHPEISVIVQEDTTDTLIKRCSHGEIDLAIVALPITAKHFEIEPLFEEELLLVVPVGHPLATKKPLTIQAIAGYPFVMLNEAHCLSENIASFCRRQSVQTVTVERTSQLATVQELVSLDHGVSIVPQMARRIDLSHQRTYRSFTGETPTRTVAMMSNTHRHQTKAVALLMDHIRRQGAPLTPTPPKSPSPQARKSRISRQNRARPLR
jgi:LysR family hydrogen peroxide-inducible transcriptional activator